VSRWEALLQPSQEGAPSIAGPVVDRGPKSLIEASPEFKEQAQLDQTWIADRSGAHDVNGERSQRLRRQLDHLMAEQHRTDGLIDETLKRTVR
jgi:hypothetical protein